MKTLKHLTASCMLFTLFIVACGKNPSKQIAKSWTVTDVRTTTELPEDLKSKMLANSEMTFTKDGRYTSTGGIGADQGTFKIDKEGKSLTTLSEAGKGSSVYTIDKLSDDNLELTNNGNTVICTARN